MIYFIIEAGEDGASIRTLTKEQLLEELAQEIEYTDNFNLDKFITDTGFNKDFNYWHNKTLIIKGEIVKPIKEESITKVSLP